jgi:hypothetical protein
MHRGRPVGSQPPPDRSRRKRWDMSKNRRMAKELFIFDVNPQSNFLTANAHPCLAIASMIEAFICSLLTGSPGSKAFTVGSR